MKFSVNWLREFVELPSSTAELADLLTFAGVEIEGMEERGGNFDQVVIGQIKESVQHPNADRLSVAQVDDGSGQMRQIVCGAKNYKVGDKIPVALPGAALPNGLKIKVSKLRGVESQGMLCSPSELKISEDGDGLLILSPDAKIGAPFASLFTPDTILDVEITPNRGDLLSYLGLAREIGALTGKPVRSPQIAEPKTTANDGIRLLSPRDCPFYSVRRIEGVNVGPSPDWLRAKLEAVGLRAINNIVDITNFVMLELGQPLHAFDADKLRGGITVRLARADETFLALDGKNYSLGPNDLMIADDARAVGIAGVMGGEETGVSASTRNILLESAYFSPASVRRTARTLGLPSDASYRFERGVDPAMTLRASARAASLMREIAGGQPAATVSIAGEPPLNPINIRLRYQRCDQLLGVAVPRSEVDRGLRNFGLLPTSPSTEGTTWKVPSHRGDLKREADLIEEVVRLHGINKIPGRNRGRFTAISAADRSYDFEARVRQTLRACGYSEARTSALVQRGAAGVTLRNPLSEDHVALRPSLHEGLLQVLERNIRAGAQSIRLFEIGRVFVFPEATEEKHLAFLCYGEAQSELSWRSEAKRSLDFFDLKGALSAIGAEASKFRRIEKEGFAFAVEVLADKTPIGFAGQLAGPRAARLDATAPILLLEIQLTALADRNAEGVKFSELDKFPSVTRDVAMVVDETLTHEAVMGAIMQEPLLTSVRLFDRFAGKEAEERFGAGRKSLAYALTYRDKNRTLTNDEVTVVHGRIRERLKSELGAELRE